ncbi:MAG: DUF1444 family protein [Phycisphaerales bacterium]
MARMPREPEAFCEHVAEILRRMCPDHEVELDGVFTLRINGRHLGLENIYRIVLNEPDRGVELVEEYLDHLMEGEEAATMALPFELAKPRIMPRIQPMSIFEHLDQNLVAFQPFVNDTALVYVLDMPHLTVSITVEQLMKWGVDLDALDQIARLNLREYSPDLEIKLVESDTGARAAILSQHDGYDASRLLLEDLHGRLRPELGADFLVATPSRDTFIAISIEPEDFAERIHQKVEEDFRKLPYPITDRYFLVTLDGVAGTAAA